MSVPNSHSIVTVKANKNITEKYFLKNNEYIYEIFHIYNKRLTVSLHTINIDSTELKSLETQTVYFNSFASYKEPISIEILEDKNLFIVLKSNQNTEFVLVKKIKNKLILENLETKI